ncbi:uncharacterized protein LOC143571192 [Bidens hawaiensis]|uniref:uncharacterized protein LOC143571192 n=1 Tax=Bidens hawaiensis TaxID=980011 RepID=UPI00404ABD5F
MAPLNATAEVPDIQAPPTNQAAPTPQVPNGHAFMMNVNQAQSSSDVVNGTFSINNYSASVLFDTSADKSFIYLYFAHIVDKPWDRFSKPFTIEVANGNSITIDSVIRDCVIVLNKFLRIPLKDGRVLKVFGSTPASKLNLMLCFHAHRYLRKKYVASLVLVVEKDKEKKKIQDIPIVRDFPDVFHDDVVGLPLIRQVEFRIDLVPRANHVAKTPYRL